MGEENLKQEKKDEIINVQMYDNDNKSAISTHSKDNSEDIPEEKSLIYISNLSDFKSLLRSCIENAMAFLFDWIPNILTLYFINNNTSQLEASGFGLGLIWANSIGQSLYYGLSSGFETLAAHAHGAGNYEQVGILYQRTLYITLLMFIPIGLSLFYAEDILLLWNSDPELCKQAGLYCISAIPGLFFAAIAFQFKASLNAQNIYNLQYQAVAWSIPFHWIISYLFISVFQLKVIGGGLAFSCSQFTSLYLLYYLVKQKKEYQKCYIPFDKRCMQEIIPFLKIVIPIGSLLTLEWLVYETYSILASNLPQAQFSAHIVLSNFNTIYYQLPEGFSIATSTFVGNEMGSNKPNRAKRFAKYGIIIALLNFSLTLMPIYYLKYEIVQMFSVDEEVLEILNQTFNIFIIAVVSDASQVILTGLMRAIGKEQFSSVSFILCYVCFGIFWAYILAYVCEFEIYGILFGAIIGSSSYNILQLYQLHKSDWHSLAQFIQERIGQDQSLELKEIKENLV